MGMADEDCTAMINPNATTVRSSSPLSHHLKQFIPWASSIILVSAASAWFEAAIDVKVYNPGGFRPEVPVDGSYLRIVTAPPSYLLGYHFVFLTSGFAIHGLHAKFLPSLYIGVAFVGAFMAIAALQVVLLFLQICSTFSQQKNKEARRERH